ncbi:hypothetical protein O9H85_37080 [Paenibacillus filicis]|uniref:Uncharacterized protein n=1 Tax=Paenibacillus gyeongsangnamensis TaxID=3388067 RepID=A0ABT4QLR5_9BACL|nr:hypothetical protein [Paenibacillus filicis]MCZ8517803.1 hypothetical protein [Paenibacillus filicis]
MSETQGTTKDHHEPELYEFRLKGHLDARWNYWFDGLSLTHERDGTTVLIVQVADQPALHGLFRKVRDLGLPLVSVIQIDPKQANGQGGYASTDHNYSRKKEPNT